MPIFRRCATAVATAVLIVFAAAAPAEELLLHVSPTGSDAWSGRFSTPTPSRDDGPLASLAGARDAIRTARSAAGWTPRPIRVAIASGTYALAQPLVLDARDGGTAAAPVVYEAEAGARPLFSGGQRIAGWRVAEDGCWEARVPDAATWRFEQLFVNGRRACRAREPDRFWSHPIEATEDAAESKNAAVKRWLRIGADDFSPLAALATDDLRDVLLTVYHKWDITQRRIEQIDTEMQAIGTSGRPMKKWNPWRRDSTYVLENARVYLDFPGEWFLARDGLLTYRPLPGESPDSADVVAPVAEHWIEVAGDPRAGAFVEHVAFRGLAFHHGQWVTPAGGCEPMQAAAWVDGMVMLDGARHVTFERCEFGHFGRYAAWFRRGCTGCAIRGCRIFDAGAGGVRIGETAKPPTPAEATADNVVEDCIIHHGGRILPCAVGVLIGWSPGNRIAHNDIGDFLYTGISAGWRWGYDESTCKGNRIVGNHIHHLGYGPLADMGGVYTLGPSEGTVISGNVIHHVHSRSYGGWGLYTDEGSTGIVLENNLVYDTKDGSFHQHFGRDNVVRNNVLVESAERQVVLTRAEPHRSFTFVHNVVAWKTGAAISGAWDKAITVTGSNCWWREDGGDVAFLGHPLAEWQRMGHEAGSVVADPKFVDPARHDYRLAPDSPAVAAGFVPFDWSTAGVRGDAAWVAAARAFEPPPLEMPPTPPTRVELSFERDPVGRPPATMDGNAGSEPARLVVTDTVAATGRRSLEFTDGAGAEPGWAPHLWVPAAIDTGVVANSFALRVGHGANLSYEWRDLSRHPYATGARLAIRDGRLWLRRGGKEEAAMDLPEDEWVRFTLSGSVGRGGPRDWSLTVEVPGREPHRFDGLAPVTADFARLTWAGFSSHATTQAIFHLDDYRLEGRQEAVPR
ncbi:MAG: right-handed parallel beta-helix repeat-containing protein [Planctomycetota bacterium]